MLLVTGGVGYIGSHVVYAALDAGMSVVVLDDFSAGAGANLPAHVPVIKGKVGDTALVRQLLQQYKPSCVLHFAGSIEVEESVRNPLKFYQNNVSQSIALLESCVAEGVSHFIFSSTAAVYGIPEQGVATETSPTHPINPYGHSKLLVEEILTQVAKVNPINIAILRYFNVAGADPDGRTGQCCDNATHLIKVACELITGKRSTMSIYGTDYPTTDGSCVRDFIHVSDLASAHLAVYEHLKATGENITINCGTGKGISVKEVLAVAEKIANKSLPIKPAKRRVGDPPLLVADVNRINAQLSWKPKYSDINCMLETALAWERKLLNTA